MSGRLDQPLDTIIGENKKAKRNTRRPKVKAPVGGVKKAQKPVKSNIKQNAAPAPRGPRNSKIIVSGLPIDVKEAQIKDYFGKSVGPIKRVSLSYNQHGESKGIAEITFVKSDSASLAAKEQNGIRIDGRPLKVEVVVDASLAPEPKSLAERIAANPKAQPKSATAPKSATKDTKKAGKAKPKKARSARPKPKTQEELDAEMEDYFNPSGAANTGATSAEAAAPAAADAMEEIS